MEHPVSAFFASTTDMQVSAVCPPFAIALHIIGIAETLASVFHQEDIFGQLDTA
jgi:hypothetical protein